MSADLAHKPNSQMVATAPTPRHFLDLLSCAESDLRLMLNFAAEAKRTRRSKDRQKPLEGRTLAMVFERPSTRTRVSFDVGMRELGGEAIMLTGAEMQLGRGETLADTARVLSRYVDAMMVRILDHAALEELARHATVPVINGLTRVSHPCQIMADILTFEERIGSIKGSSIAWVGDGNNVLTSWIEAASVFGCELRIAAPKELAPNTQALQKAQSIGARVTLVDDPYDAVKGVQAVITDCWVSMGDKDAERRHALLAPYQVNKRLMSAADKNAIFMHCLPAHRGEEVTEEIIDGPQSAVFDEAENRLHAQKGVLAWAMNAI